PYGGITHIGQDINVNEGGDEYVGTKYGFASASRYNQKMTISESDRLIEELHYNRNVLKENADKDAETSRVRAAQSRERKEKIKKMTQPFLDENESLRREIKLLKSELTEYKQTNESVIGKLTRLVKQTNERSSTAEVPGWDFRTG